MRKLIVSNIVSLDGYYEGPGGDVMALPMDHGFDAYNAERLRAADTLLLGRESYELFRDFWPAVAEDPSATPDQREIARLDEAIDKIVVSDSLSVEDTDPWRETTRIVPRAEAHDAVAELRSGSGKDILVFGSRTLWNDLLVERMVDELHLMVGSVVVGDGTRAFGGETPSSLRLLDTRTWEGSGNMLVRYAVGEAA